MSKTIRDALDHVLDGPDDDISAPTAREILRNGWANGNSAEGREVAALLALAAGASMDDEIA